MLFAYSTSICRARPLREAIETIALGGFCAVGIMADRPQAFPDDLTAAQISSLTQYLSDRKIKLSNMNGCKAAALGDLHQPSWIEEDWKKRESRIRYTLDTMRLAAAMGIPSVSTMAAGAIPETMNRKDAWRLFVADMQRVLPLASKLGVKLLIQPEPGMLLETADDMYMFLKEMEFPEALGVDFSLAHIVLAGEGPCTAWEKLKPHIHHVHLSNIPLDRSHRHIQLGQGVIDIAGFLGCVRDSGYQGFLTVELESSDQSAEEMVANTAQYLHELGFWPQSGQSCG